VRQEQHVQFVDQLLKAGLGEQGICGDDTDVDKVLLLPQYLEGDTGTGKPGGKLLVTKHFYNIARRFEDVGFKSVLLKGLPGVGKSLLFMYVLLRNLALGRIVLAEWGRPAQADSRSKDSVERYVFLPSRQATQPKNEVRYARVQSSDSWSSLMGAFLDASKQFHALWHAWDDNGRNGPSPLPRCVLLGYGDAPKSCQRCVFVSFSPFKNNFHNYIKDAQPDCLTLPVPSPAEMMEIVSKCYPEAIAQAKRRIDVVGPWPRLLLRSDEPTEDWIRSQIRSSATAIHRVKRAAPTELDTDFSNVRVSELVVGLRLDSKGDVVAAEDNAKPPRWFWNDVPRIIELVYDHLRHLDSSIARQILSWEEHRLFHTLVGGVFEGSEYVHIWQGDEFDVKPALRAYERKRWSEPRKSTRTPLAQDLAPLTMKQCITELTDVDAATKRGRLVVPLVENFPVRAAATALPLPRFCRPALLLSLSEQLLPHRTIPCCLPPVSHLSAAYPLAQVIDGIGAFRGKPALLQVKKREQKAINKDTFTRTIAEFRTAYNLKRTDPVAFIYVVKEGFEDDSCRAPTFEGISGFDNWNAFVDRLNVTFYLACCEAAARGGAGHTRNRKRPRSGGHDP
jgi:hypothetical protein